MAIIIMNCAVICLLGTIYAFGQEKETEIKNKKITMNLEKQPLGIVFRQLMVNYDVAIGFEESILDREHNDYDFETNLPNLKGQKSVSDDGNVEISVVSERVYTVKQHWFTINVKDERLEDVLNTIIAQMKNYKWEINDDVVNIFPIRGRDERYASLLNLNIKNFDLGKPTPPIFLVRNKLITLPEIKSFLDENKLFISFYRESLDNLARKLPSELSFSNLTLRELFNKITKIKRGGWILKTNDIFGTKEKEYIEIDI